MTLTAVDAAAAVTPMSPARDRRRACARIALGLLLFFALDSAIFRSGLYLRWVAPDSGLGTMNRIVRDIRHIPPGQHSILVVGDSRIAEGFSAKLATSEAKRLGTDLVFVSGGIPGTLPRVWYYMLRQIEHPSSRITAVAVMTTTYQDNDLEVQAERRGDIVFMHPLLSLSDVVDFPRSFRSGANQWQALQAILFSGLFYKNDVQDFLTHPIARIRQAELWRKHAAEWTANYPGRPSSLAGLTFDLASGTLQVAPDHPPTQPNTLASYAEALHRAPGVAAENAEAEAYRRMWYGRIAALCQQNGIKLIVFRIPRGPLHSLADAAEHPTGALADLAAAGQLQLLPADTFDGLEHPAFFFDDLHLNHDGRERLSVGLADAMVARLAPPP